MKINYYLQSHMDIITFVYCVSAVGNPGGAMKQTTALDLVLVLSLF
jgi:hypothetical protein